MRIVILGGGFAGLSAALHLQARLGREHEVVVVSDRDEFVYAPALLWIPFGLLGAREATFSLRATLGARGIRFEQTRVRALDLRARRLVGADGRALMYDRLVLATGPRPDWAAVPGLGRRDRAHSIFSPADALATQRDLRRVLADPAPVVVGLAHGASCFGATYRLALNIARELRARGHTNVPVTFVTPEPYLGHFGIGGLGAAPASLPEAFDALGIRAEFDARVRAVRPDRVLLADGREVPFGFAMLLPRFTTADTVRAREELLDASGFVRIDPYYRTLAYPGEVYAAGSTVSIPAVAPARVPCGVPRSPMMAEEMGRVVAHNVAADILGLPALARPPAELLADRLREYTLDDDLASADPFLDARADAWSTARIESRWADVAMARAGAREREARVG